MNPTLSMTASAATTTSRDEAHERLGRLFDAQHQRIYRLARRMTRDSEEARDVLQETFLRAAKRWRSLPRERAAAEAWLVRTATNLCVDLGRRGAVRRRDRHKIEPPPTRGGNPESRAVARASVQAALASLPPKRRAVVVLAELEGLSTRQISRLLGSPQPTIRWHLSKGRREMRAALERNLR